MADQSFWFPDGIAKDIMVNIRDHYVLTDFMVLDMGDEDEVHLILGRPFLNTTRAAIYIRIGEVHFQFQSEKVRCYLIVTLLMKFVGRIGQEGGVVNVKRNKPPRMDGQTIQEKCQGMKTDSMMKIKVLLRKKPYHQHQKRLRHQQKMYQSLQKEDHKKDP